MRGARPEALGHLEPLGRVCHPYLPLPSLGQSPDLPDSGRHLGCRTHHHVSAGAPDRYDPSLAFREVSRARPHPQPFARLVAHGQLAQQPSQQRPAVPVDPPLSRVSASCTEREYQQLTVSDRGTGPTVWLGRSRHEPTLPGSYSGRAGGTEPPRSATTETWQVTGSVDPNSLGVPVQQTATGPDGPDTLVPVHAHALIRPAFAVYSLTSRS